MIGDPLSIRNTCRVLESDAQCAHVRASLTLLSVDKRATEDKVKLPTMIRDSWDWT